MEQSKEVQILVQRALGATNASIAKSAGVSERTVTRVCKLHRAKKGSHVNEVKSAISKDLVDDIANGDEIKTVLTTLVNSSVQSMADSNKRLKQAVLNLDAPQSLDDYLKLARAESAVATTTKLQIDTLRSLLRHGESLPTIEGLPELVIHCMTAEEVATMRQEQEDEKNQIYGEGDLPLH